MAARKKELKCHECGAVLAAGPGSCPLCGAEPSQPRTTSPSRPAVGEDEYQAQVRKLREQLRALREDGAEAV